MLEHMKAWGGIAAITRSAKGCVVIKGQEVHAVPASAGGEGDGHHRRGRSVRGGLPVMA